MKNQKLITDVILFGNNSDYDTVTKFNYDAMIIQDE